MEHHGNEKERVEELDAEEQDEMIVNDKMFDIAVAKGH